MDTNAGRWDSRFIAGEECWAKMGGYRMRYLRMSAKTDSGRPPLVLVHGLLGYSFSWRHNIEVMAEGRDVYAIDLLGFGFSERPVRDKVSYSLRATAERLLVWMKEMGFRKTDLVGTSHGGGVATMMAALDHDRGTGLIGRLVLVASIHPWSKAGLRRTKVLGHRVGATMFRAVVSMFGIFSIARELMIERMYGDPRKITADTRAGYDAPIEIAGTVDYALGIVRHWHADLRELEVAIRTISGMPVLLVWGSRDSAVPISSAQVLMQNLKGAKLVVFEGVGHLPYEESPEEFNRALRNFLEGETRSVQSAGL